MQSRQTALLFRLSHRRLYPPGLCEGAGNWRNQPNLRFPLKVYKTKARNTGDYAFCRVNHSMRIRVQACVDRPFSVDTKIFAVMLDEMQIGIAEENHRVAALVTLALNTSD